MPISDLYKGLIDTVITFKAISPAFTNESVEKGTFWNVIAYASMAIIFNDEIPLPAELENTKH